MNGYQNEAQPSTYSKDIWSGGSTGHNRARHGYAKGLGNKLNNVFDRPKEGRGI